MPDKDAPGFACGGYISSDGVHWAPISDAVPFDFVVPASAARPPWEQIDLAALCNPIAGTLSFKLPWWFGYQGSHHYTIRILRRGGKSHRGKHA